MRSIEEQILMWIQHKLPALRLRVDATRAAVERGERILQRK